jgi:uncharacterized membrane protein
VGEQEMNTQCQVCGKVHGTGMVVGAAVRDGLAGVIRAEHPEFDATRPVCAGCTAKYRAEYVRSLLEAERGELTALDEQVVNALKTQETLATNINHEFHEGRSVGGRVADKVAAFGGSWTFIGIFGGVIITWMVINAGAILGKPFDPYPFILLNLVLSTLAAFQAPIIMMSQNRQAAKDRLQAEHDYRVNLKAELEIRLLHAKLDQLLTHQWQRLMEIQRVQMEMMEEMGGK